MKKQLFWMTTMTILLMGLNTIFDGVQESKASDMLIGKAVQFPDRKSTVVRHTIKINIADHNRAISQLKIIIPEGLIVKNDIRVQQESGQVIKVNTSIDNKTITLDFAEPISSNTKINLNQVIILGVSHEWIYRIYGDFVGITPQLDLGIAEIHTY